MPFGPALIILAAALALPPSGKVVQVLRKDGVAPPTYVAGSLSLTPTYTTLPHGETRADLVVRSHGASVLTLRGAETGMAIAPVGFAVARMDAAADGPGVFFYAYTGGAHCCSVMQVGGSLQGRWRAVPIAETDSGEPEAVTDVDGDGVADIVSADDAFDYAFASFAGSVRPPVIYNLRNGVVWDVSAEPKYRFLFRRQMTQVAPVCLKASPEQDEINGACAAYVADAARLGQFEPAWRRMLARYDHSKTDWPSGCTIPARPGACPKDKLVTYPDYPTALRALLQRRGYLRTPGEPAERPVDKAATVG